jgi:hypothetical protein
MRAQNGISRRHILALSAAAGSLAIGSGLREASGQAGKRIERLGPSLDKIIDTSQPIRELGAQWPGNRTLMHAASVPVVPAVPIKCPAN